MHKDPDLTALLAKRFGIPADELNKRRYAAPRRSLSSIQFAGQEIRETVFAGREPRIAPHTIWKIGYHRMCWDLEFVIADPETGERLISECPSCKSALRWSRPEFLNCHNCDQSFTKAPPSYVSNDVRLAAAIFSGLLSFDRDVIKDARSCFSPVLRRVPSGKLLQALYELSSRPISERKGRGAVPVELDWERGLVRMLQIAIGWPDAVLGLLNELTVGGRKRQDKSAAGFTYGRMRKVLPAWGPIPEIHGVALPVARAIASGRTEPYHPHQRFAGRHSIQSDPAHPGAAVAPYDWFQQKVDDLSVSPSSKRGNLAEDLADLASPEMIKIRWGLDKEVVSELTSAGYLCLVDDNYRNITGSVGPLYRISDIEKFFASLRDRQEAAPRNTRRVGFTMITLKLGSKLDAPHAYLVRAIYDGSFRPIFIKEKARTGLECFQFSSDRAGDWISEQLGQARGSIAMSLAAKELGVDFDVIVRLLAAGLLMKAPDLFNSDRTAISIESWKQFRTQYVAISEIAKLKRVPYALVASSIEHFNVKTVTFRGAKLPVCARRDIPSTFRILSRLESRSKMMG